MFATESQIMAVLCFNILLSETNIDNQANHFNGGQAACLQIPANNLKTVRCHESLTFNVEN